MSTMTKIPHGDDKVTVELTLKELMALTGVRFHDNHKVKISAKQKLNEVIEEAYDIDHKSSLPSDQRYLL